MFGRDAELRLMHDARRALSRRRGSVVLLGGEPGMGKSRLLAEFTSSIGGGRAPYYAYGEALEDAPRPYGPFRSVLASLVRASRYAPDDTTSVTARALSALIPDSIGDARRAMPSSERIEKAELFAGVLGYFSTLTEKRATIVALEDLHWADSATLELLCHLAPRIGQMRLMIVATYRDDEIHPQRRIFAPLARLVRESTVHHAVLEPLTPGDVRALIDDALGSSYTLSADGIRDVAAGCDGNPFFAEEMLKRAVESERTGQVGPLPLSIRALTLERIAALSPLERGVLDCAAVLGQCFAAESLASLAQCSSTQVVEALTKLRALSILLRDESLRAPVRFRHALTRQTVYDELPPERAREMHERIVALLEEQSEADLDGLAYHAWRAGLRERTLDYSERAGDAALVVRAAVQAATYFERALELADDDTARIRLLGKNGEAWLQQSDFARATAAYTAQQQLLEARGDFDGAARALTRAAGETANAGRIREALGALMSFEATHSADLSRRAGDHLNVTIARIATADEDFSLARAALAKVADPRNLEAFSHQVYWLARLFTSEHDLDLTAWREAAAALQRRNPETYPLMRSQMLHSIASTAITFAENDLAKRAIDSAIATDQECGFFRPLAFANAVKACLSCVSGRLGEARACIDAALAEPDLFVVRLELALGASPVALALGDYDLARRLLADDFAASIREAGMATAASLFDGMRAALLFALGRRVEAQSLLESCIDNPPHPFAVVHFWPFASRYADDSRLVRLRELCASDAAQPGQRVRRACAALLKAAAARRAGKPEASIDAEAAAALYNEVGWPLHEAHALELAGREDAALQIYHACASIADVRRLEVRSPGRAVSVRRSRLSPRERQVAGMITRGFTNRGIAEELSVTEKTIEKHITSIYAKLGFSTRTQLAAHIARLTDP